MKSFNIFTLAVLAAMTFPANAQAALTLGTNITIPDNKYSGSDWYSNREDNEVEPGMEQKQKWDLEGFFLNGQVLSIVGGFNFKEGVYVNGYNDGPNDDGDKYNYFISGDIFIDIDGHYGKNYGPAPSGNSNKKVSSAYGYEYVFDLNFSNSTYVLIDLTKGASAETKTAYFTQNQDSNPSSNPWLYVQGGTMVDTGSFTFYDDTNSYGFNGEAGNNKHYAISGLEMDPAIFGYGKEFTSHFTMECGNDNLMGTGTTPVPEPTTMLLFGTGLAGLAGGTRLRKTKKT